MFDVLGLFKWFVNLARKDKVLAIIAVLFAAIFVSSYITYRVSAKSDAKDEKNEVRADARQNKCDSINSVLYAQIAALNIRLYESAKEYNSDLKEQRDKYQSIAGERDILVQELQLANKRNARKLKELAPVIEQKNEN